LQVALLDRAAELSPQFMRPRPDHRIVGHPLNRPVGSIECDRDLRCFDEQGREFLSQFLDVTFHGAAPDPESADLQTTTSRVTYHRSVEFLD